MTKDEMIKLPDLEGMAEAFSRVIEAHMDRAGPFYSPAASDATVALRELRSLRAAVERATADIVTEATNLMHECADLRAEVERLRGVLTSIVDFVDGPAEEKRPDVFALRIKAARAALKETK